MLQAGFNPSAGPDFICFGLQKAGTQWLYDQMNSCEQVWMTPVKELDYFVGDMQKPSNAKIVKNFYAPGLEQQRERPDEERFFSAFRPENPAVRDEDWYRGLFAPKMNRISGDVSPMYATAGDRQIQRIYNTCPTAKYIFLLRHPVDRLWSAVCMHLRRGKVTTNDLHNWKSVRKLIQRSNYVQRSYPSRIWSRWMAHVPAASIQYWFMDDIIADPSKVRSEILSHVGVDAPRFTLPANYNRKSNKVKIPMPADVAVGLAEWFEEEIADCRRIFGGAANTWAG